MAAWALLGIRPQLHESCLDPLVVHFSTVYEASTHALPRRPLEDSVNNDLFFIGLTIVVFAVLLLILKGVERFER